MKSGTDPDVFITKVLHLAEQKLLVVLFLKKDAPIFFSTICLRTIQC